MAEVLAVGELLEDWYIIQSCPICGALIKVYEGDFRITCHSGICLAGYNCPFCTMGVDMELDLIPTLVRRRLIEEWLNY